MLGDLIATMMVAMMIFFIELLYVATRDIEMIDEYSAAWIITNTVLIVGSAVVFIGAAFSTGVLVLLA